MILIIILLILLLALPNALSMAITNDNGDGNSTVVVVLSEGFCNQNWIASFICRILCYLIPFLFVCNSSDPTSTVSPTTSPVVTNTMSPTTISPVVEGLFYYYQTCGDPVCSGWREKDGISMCSDFNDVQVGQPCDNEKGFVCDPINFCNSLIACTDIDPTTLPGGCPISYRHIKKDIQYLNQEQLQEISKSILSFKLATWKYKHHQQQSMTEINGNGATDETHLGFIIDDILGEKKESYDGGGTTSTTTEKESSSSLAIDEKRGMVDLYGYLSMAVAAIQTQQQDINNLRNEIELLKSSSVNNNKFSSSNDSRTEENNAL